MRGSNGSRRRHTSMSPTSRRVSWIAWSQTLVWNPPPPDPIVLTANALASHIQGADFELARRITTHVSTFANLTHYFSRKELLPTTGERKILNVATNTVRAGVDLDFGRLSTRFSARTSRGDRIRTSMSRVHRSSTIRISRSPI
jgi:hypothetical protein